MSSAEASAASSEHLVTAVTHVESKRIETDVLARVGIAFEFVFGEQGLGRLMSPRRPQPRHNAPLDIQARHMSTTAETQ